MIDGETQCDRSSEGVTYEMDWLRALIDHGAHDGSIVILVGMLIFGQLVAASVAVQIGGQDAKPLSSLSGFHWPL